MNKVDLIKQSEFFSGLDEKAIQELSQLCKEEVFKSGDIIVRQGETAKRFFIVVAGSISLRIEEAGGSITTINERGSLFGWSSLIEPYRYTATAIAMDDTSALSIEAGPFKNLFLEKNLKFAFDFMYRLVQLINRRLEDSRSQLISSLQGARPITQG
jgi:CRP-like cAMP-binding protein